MTAPDGRQNVSSFCLFCPDAYDDTRDIALKTFVDRNEKKVIREFSNALNKLFNYIIDNLNRYPYPILDSVEQKLYDSSTDCEYTVADHSLLMILNVAIIIIIQGNMREQHVEDAI
jgi:hypothetical protein